MPAGFEGSSLQALKATFVAPSVRDRRQQPVRSDGKAPTLEGIEPPSDAGVSLKDASFLPNSASFL